MDFSLKSSLAQASVFSLCTIWHGICKINPNTLLGIHNVEWVDGVSLAIYCFCGMHTLQS